jgi:hypothetical protein
MAILFLFRPCVCVRVCVGGEGFFIVLASPCYAAVPSHVLAAARAEAAGETPKGPRSLSLCGHRAAHGAAVTLVIGPVWP